MVDTLFIVPFLQFVYQLLLGLAEMLWDLARSGLLAGYVIGRVDDWFLSDGFGSTIGLLTNTGDVLLPVFASVAVIALGLSYVLAAWVKIQVVNWQSALGWLLFGLLFYSLAPSLYAEGEGFRRALASGMYDLLLAEANLTTVQSDLSAIAASPSPGTGVVADQFGDGYRDGLDVAMAYVLADGEDVLASPDTLPDMFRATFFDPEQGALQFLILTPEERHAAITTAVAGIGRLVLVWLIIGFGLFEQLIYLLLSLAAGLLFVQMAIVLPFALFIRTELLARTLVDMWIELFIKTAVISVLQAFGVTLVLLGAEIGNPVLALGTSLVGWGLMAIFLVAAARAVWDALNRMFAALSSLVGGRVMQPGQAAALATEVTVGALTGIGLAAASGGLALAGGGTEAQALGAVLGRNQTVYTASALGSRMLPEGSAQQQMAQQVFDGALYRRMMGPVGALALGSSRESRGSASAEPAAAQPVGQAAAPSAGASLPQPGAPPRLEVNVRELADAIGKAIDQAPAGGYRDFLQAGGQVAQVMEQSSPQGRPAFGNTTITIGSIVTALHQAGVSGPTAAEAIHEAASTGSVPDSLAQEIEHAGQRSGFHNLSEQVRRAGETIARRTQQS